MKVLNTLVLLIKMHIGYKYNIIGASPSVYVVSSWAKLVTTKIDQSRSCTFVHPGSYMYVVGFLSYNRPLAASHCDVVEYLPWILVTPWPFIIIVWHIHVHYLCKSNTMQYNTIQYNTMHYYIRTLVFL